MREVQQIAVGKNAKQTIPTILKQTATPSVIPKFSARFWHVHAIVHYEDLGMCGQLVK